MNIDTVTFHFLKDSKHIYLYIYITRSNKPINMSDNLHTIFILSPCIFEKYIKIDSIHLLAFKE